MTVTTAVFGFGEVVVVPPGVGRGAQLRVLQKTAHRFEIGCGGFQTDRSDLAVDDQHNAIANHGFVYVSVEESASSRLV